MSQPESALSQTKFAPAQYVNTLSRSENTTSQYVTTTSQFIA